MQIRFLATSSSPDSYSFDGEVITANHNGSAEDFDLSGLEEGGKFDSNFTVDTLELNNSQIIRDAERVNGELLVKLCQHPPITKVSLFTLDGMATVPHNYYQFIRKEWKADLFIDLINKIDETIVVDGNELSFKEYFDSINDNENINADLFIDLVKKVKYMESLEEDMSFDDYVQRVVMHQGGDWDESDWIDSTDYQENTLYIKEK